MKLPETDHPEKYVGLYVIDFGPDQPCAVGYTAEEVGTLLESELFAEAKVYKVYRGRPDGTMELQGVAPERFQLESGMFFYCLDDVSGGDDFSALLEWSYDHPPVCRAKLHLARGERGRVVIALIYPGEYEQEIGDWLAQSGFRGGGPVDAGPSQVDGYYNGRFERLREEQLWPMTAYKGRDFQTLRAAVNEPFQR